MQRKRIGIGGDFLTILPVLKQFFTLQKQLHKNCWMAEGSWKFQKLPSGRKGMLLLVVRTRLTVTMKWQKGSVAGIYEWKRGMRLFHLYAFYGQHWKTEISTGPWHKVLEGEQDTTLKFKLKGVWLLLIFANFMNIWSDSQVRLCVFWEWHCTYFICRVLFTFHFVYLAVSK